MAGPIVKRDLVSFLRNPWSFALVFLALALTGAAVCERWVSVRQTWIDELTDRSTLQMVAMQGRDMFRLLVRGQLLILTLLAPLVSAAAIAGERERDTFVLLLSSPVAMAWVIFEKFISAQAFLLLLLVATVPVLAVSLLAGGLSADEIVAAEALSVLAALGYGMLGLFCSTFRSKVYETYSLTVLVILGAALLLPFGRAVGHYVLTLDWTPPAIGAHGIHEFSPLVALDRIIPPAGLRGPSQSFAGRPELGLFWFALVWIPAIGILFYWTRLRLESLAHGDRVRKQETEEADDSPYTVQFERPRLGYRAGVGGSGPLSVLALERHRQWFGRMTVLLRLLYVALLVSVVTLPLASYRGSWLFFTIPFLAAAFFTVPLAATTMGSERDGETLDVLRTTLVGEEAIVNAKYRVALQLSLILSLALYLPGLLTMTVSGLVFGHELDLLLDSRDFIPLLAYPVLLFCSLRLYNALGLWFSSRFQSTNLALVATSLAVFTLLLAPLPLLDAVSGWAPQSLSLPMKVAVYALIAAPLAATNPLAVLILLSTEGNIELLGLQVESALEPFTSFAPLFLVLYGLFCYVAAYFLTRRAEIDLWRS